MEIYGNGATRSPQEDQLDYEGFLSPLVLERYALYLHKHRFQADGNVRDSDNWQRGIPHWRYMKGMWRHFMEVFQFHRKAYIAKPSGNTFEEALCALMFNVMGYLHELLKEKYAALERCDKEIARCEGGVMQKVDPSGAILGLRDWHAEKKLINNGGR